MKFLLVNVPDFSGCIDIFENNVDYLESTSGHSKVEMHFSYGNDIYMHSLLHKFCQPLGLPFLQPVHTHNTPFASH